MNQPGKWISDLTADTRVSDAARRVLTLRLEAVRDWLGQALREPGQDSEYVHQLRVATRRAGAALNVFAECLPPKVAKDAQDRLKLIRRAAGEARDWDVFLGRLQQTAAEQPAEDRAGLDMVVGYALAQRIPAQRKLEKASPDYPFAFERFMAESLAAIRTKGVSKATLAELGRPLLARLLGQLSRPELREISDYPGLHQVRILGKRLRYVLEIFNDCFGPRLRKRLCPLVAELQEILGSVNDHFNAARLYATLRTELKSCLPGGAARYQGLIDRLGKQHEAHLPAGRRKFVQWCERWAQPDVQLAVAEIVVRGPTGQAVLSSPPVPAPGAVLEGPLAAPVTDAATRCA